MSDYVKFHGLKLADNSTIENLKIERLTADPTPTEAGRLWYNETSKVFKFSSLDAGGAVITTTAATLSDLSTEVATLNTSISNETTARSNADTTLQTNIDNLQTTVGNRTATVIIAVTNNGTTSFLMDGVANAELQLTPGITYRFDLNIGSHPLVITNALVTSNFSAAYYNTGLSHIESGTTVTGSAAQGKSSGSLIFKVPHDAPDSLYYICTNHPAAMKGALKTTSFPATVQTEIDAIETGAGLGSSGAYTADNTSTYITAASSLKNADTIIDNQLNLTQTELDTTQNAAGLSSSGAYTAIGSANYINSATTLKNADQLLDTQLKTTTDDLATETNNRTSAESTINTNITNLQSEVDAIETGAGLGSSGAYSANVSTNYIGSATSLKTADEALDTNLKNAKDEIDTIEASVGLSATGTFTAGSGTIITNSTSFKHADELLDAAIGGKLEKSGGTMSGVLDMGSQKITSLATPTAATDASTKGYVDSVASGLDVKGSVRVASTTNVSTSTVTTIDGVTLVTGDRVLLKNQTTSSQNGIYDWAGNALTRTSDANTGAVMNSGMFVFVEEGTANANNGYVLTTVNPITAGTTALVFEQFSGAGQITAGAGIKKNGNELYLSFGAGISELPSDEVGIDVKTDGGLWTTTNNSSSATTTAAQLAVKLDGSTLELSTAGLKVGTGITNVTTGIQTEVDAIETSIGLASDGSYTTPTGTNYINAASGVSNAIVLLDTQIKATYDDLEAQILEVDTASETAARIAGDAAVRSSFNALKFTYQSSSTATTHTVTHNLNSNFLMIQVMVLGDDNVYSNDVVPVDETNANTLTVTLTEARHIRVSVLSMTAI